MHYSEIRARSVLISHKFRHKYHGYHDEGHDVVINWGQVAVLQYFIIILCFYYGGGVPPPPLHHCGGIDVERKNPPHVCWRDILPQYRPGQFRLDHQNVPRVDLVQGGVLSLQLFQKVLVIKYLPVYHNRLHVNGGDGAYQPQDLNNPQNVDGLVMESLPDDIGGGVGVAGSQRILI